MSLHGAPRAPRSSLDIGRSPTCGGAMEAMRRRAWQEQGVATLAIGEVADDWLRQAIVNEAVRRWGPRREGDGR
jgi:hypothetical protein